MRRADGSSFDEYFDEMGHVEQALLPQGVVALFKQALGKLACSIGGTGVVAP